jgi:methylamine---glutamate N-methyltransferase subunit B
VDDSRSPSTAVEVLISVPEIRDFHAINAEILRHLDRGYRRIRLAGVRGQRLIVSRLTGPWDATIAVDGDAGPELAAGLEAPALTVVCLGQAADGAASGLRAGRLLALGLVGTAFGYAQQGGRAVAVAHAGPRAGLRQSGGDLVLLGHAGPLAGECQSGGRVFAFADRLGPHAGRGSRGGRFIRLGPGPGGSPEPVANRNALLDVLEPVRAWLPPAPGS